MYPGSGRDEYIDPADWNKYAVLSTIPNWRRMLSNFYARDGDVPLFQLDGLDWKSVEHYYHANKFIDIDDGYYLSFAMDSESPLSRADGAAAKKAGGTRRMTADQAAGWNARKHDVLAKAREAKFVQNPDLARVLVLTDGATLTHRAWSKAPLVVEYQLMALRDRLK